MTTPPTLKPCPFCDGEAELNGQDSPSFCLCRVSCDSCGASGPSFKTRERAADHWNGRGDASAAPPAPDDARLEEIRKLHDCGCEVCSTVSVVCPASASSYAEEILRLRTKVGTVHPDRCTLGHLYIGGVCQCHDNSDTLDELREKLGCDAEHNPFDRVDELRAELAKRDDEILDLQALVGRAARYHQLLPTIRLHAKRLGYAIGVHGSMTRDLDLIAVPWSDGASSVADLVRAVAEGINGSLTDEEPTEKPFGRLAWTIVLRGGPYSNRAGGCFVDLSVLRTALDAAAAKEKP